MTDAAAAVLRQLGVRGWTIATAESLTGGLLAAEIVAVPGASASMRGGVVAYATEIKQAVLRVDADLLTAVGAVDPVVACQMAEGVRTLLNADVGLATTGVAGPEPQDGQPVGTVHIAVVTPTRTAFASLQLSGSRQEIRRVCVDRALELCVAEL